MSGRHAGQGFRRPCREGDGHGFRRRLLRCHRQIERRVRYRIVARRKGIRRHRRFAKVDTRLPVSRAPTARKPAPTTAALRAFVAGLEKEARQRRPKGAGKAAQRGAAPAAPALVWSPPHARRDASQRPM
jgi:hypothetical protein